MVGKDIISLSVELGIGSEKGVKKVDGVPFLIIFTRNWQNYFYH